MRRYEALSLGIGIATLVWSCASMSPSSSAGAEHSFKNLRVLPKNIERKALIDIMKGYTRALGVRCTFCHEGEEGSMDFASDAKDEKRNARVMIEMTRAINTEYISRVEGHGTIVECATCHRGKVVPEAKTETATEERH